MSNVAFPELRFVPLEQCVLHEETDPTRVARLVDRIRREERLRNPPILGRVAGLETLLVLDGATRVTALQQLGITHILGQVVNYTDPAVELHTWAHALAGQPWEALADLLHQDPQLHTAFSTVEAAKIALHERQLLAFLANREGHALVIHRPSSIVEQAAVLRHLFACYAAQATITRVPAVEWQGFLQHHPINAIMVFSVYEKDDLIALARQKAVLLPGITRHIIPGRALRLNVSLEILQADQELSVKQTWLENWLRTRNAERSVRYYTEPIFLFDE